MLEIILYDYKDERICYFDCRIVPQKGDIIKTDIGYVTVKKRTFVDEDIVHLTVSMPRKEN